jgi:predicted ATPase
MLMVFLGTTHLQDELVALVLEKCEGIPFFLEELVKSLQEAEAINLHDGQRRRSPMPLKCCSLLRPLAIANYGR